MQIAHWSHRLFVDLSIYLQGQDSRARGGGYSFHVFQIRTSFKINAPQ